MDKNEKKIWQLYKKTKRKELLEKIVEENLNIVHYYANRLYIFTSHTMEKDDLYSAGVMGLLDAIEKFDMSKNASFKTYASIRVRGSIIDEIRKVDWVPRSVRKKSKDIDAAINHYLNEHGSMPTDKEIAAELDLTIEEYYKITDNLGPSFVSSLDIEVYSSKDGDKIKLKEMLKDNSQENYEEKRIRENIRRNIIESIGNLPENEKLVISLYYYENLTLKEIAMILEVTESRISQIHSSALNKLRVMLNSLK